MTHLSLADGPEFDRIREILASLGDQAVGTGDDTATIPEGEGRLVTSVDASIEGVHFRNEWLAANEIGWRATVAALSDLAAAGATPVGMLVALALPTDGAPEGVAALARGIADAARTARCPVRGGDLTAAERLMVSVTVFGRATRPMSRRGAAAGDEVWVTGTLGGARAALVSWQHGRTPSPAARAAFARPHPRLSAGRWLAAVGATAMIDVSDGLAGDAPHLAAASDVRLEVDLDAVPIHPSVHGAVRDVDETVACFVAVGGEDYELLCTAPRGRIVAAEAEAAMGVPLTRIGVVTPGRGVRLVTGGREVSLGGFRHRL